MDTERIVIRIKTPDGDMDSTVDCPSLLSFSDLLNAIRDVMPEATITAFEYEDEVGDRITVRSDEELKAMLSYVSTLGALVCGRLSSSPCEGLAHTRVPVLHLPSPPLPPSLINEQNIRYQELLGHGNGGTVYSHSAVPDLATFLSWFLQVIPLDITVEQQKQIMSELEILYKCDSPYIITFYSAFFVENRISICTEFMDGGSLDVYRRISEHVLGRIAVAVVKGLTYLWSLKILHRDVKPSNMLVNTRGQVKLCDFGVSTQLVNSIAKTYVGTNVYMAPERISGEQYGIHSDVWSLGISFMEVSSLLIRFPFLSPPFKPLQLLQCIVDEDPPVLPVGQFSETFVHFITQCMRKQPKERPAPNNLMDHEFIMLYNDGNTEVVSMWVCRCLEERRAQQPQPQPHSVM
uniref:mitogen-activated protein kinase kinase n=1 Tax=Paramormyrops kingsleyae TaxID=1676925 RepID=A0A3B3T7J4_9TELE